jgi:simple sugar transport system permease protein
VNVNRVRYLYTILGGALVGIAGAAYSLNVKIGWSDGHVRGFGWIALAIVIFGGWSPIRGAFGALLFGATKALATLLQRAFPEVSVVAFNALPWLLMILVLPLWATTTRAVYRSDAPQLAAVAARAARLAAHGVGTLFMRALR